MRAERRALMLLAAFTVMTVRMPNERDDTGTVKVDVRFPDGFFSVLHRKVRGGRPGSSGRSWTRRSSGTA